MVQVKLRYCFVVIGVTLSLLAACGEVVSQTPVLMEKTLENQHLKPGSASIDMQYSVPKNIADGESVDINLTFTVLRPYPQGSELVIELAGDNGLMLVGEGRHTFSLSDEASYAVFVQVVRQSSTKPYLRIVATVEYEGKKSQRRFIVIVGERKMPLEKSSIYSEEREQVRNFEAEEEILQSPK